MRISIEPGPEKERFDDIEEGAFFWSGCLLYLKPVMGYFTENIVELDLGIAISLDDNILVVFKYEELVTAEKKPLAIIVDRN